MLDMLRRSIPLPMLAAGIGAAVLAVAAYCVAYTSLIGRPETFPQAIGWGVANVAPWLAAVEAGKRLPSWRAATGALAAALIVSLILGYLVSARADPLAFECVRRLPGLGAASATIALLRSPAGRKTGNEQMTLLPRQIDWVRAAGNYVELRAGGRTIVQRASISAVERDLAKHGFVRIHRSMLVRRDRIVRVRPQDVVLHDGTHLPLGKRYRSALAA
jgi:hypothetical protein